MLERAINAKAAELQDEIEKRPTWTFYTVFSAIFLFILGGSFLYTTLVMTSMEKTIIRENEKQDRVIERMDSKLDRIIDKMDGKVKGGNHESK